MNLMPEYLDMAFALKIQLSPINVAMLIALGLDLLNPTMRRESR